MPNEIEQEEEQEKDRSLARELAEEKAKKALKKAAKEVMKRAVKKAAGAAAKKIALAGGKIIGAVLVKTAPIWGIILLIILTVVIILVILSGGGTEACPELALLKEQEPATFEEIKKQYEARGEDLEVICGWKTPSPKQKTAKDIVEEKGRLTPKPGTEGDIRAGGGLPGLELE